MKKAVLAIWLLVLGLPGMSAKATSAERPNIVFILADDK